MFSTLVGIVIGAVVVVVVPAAFVWVKKQVTSVEAKANTVIDAAKSAVEKKL